MKTPKARPLAIPPEKKAEFRQLTQIPNYSWPCLMLAVVTMGSVITIDALALTGNISIGLATALLIVPYYWFFAVIHDGVHRSIANRQNTE